MPTFLVSGAISVSTALILGFSLLCIFLGLGCLPGLCSPAGRNRKWNRFILSPLFGSGRPFMKAPQRANIPEKKFSRDRSSHNFTQNCPSQPSNLLVLWIWMWCSAFSVKTVIKTVLFQEGPKLTSRFCPM